MKFSINYSMLGGFVAVSKILGFLFCVWDEVGECVSQGYNFVAISSFDCDVHCIKSGWVSVLVVSCGCSGGRVCPARLKGNSASGMSWNWSAGLTLICGAIVSDLIL